MSAQTKYGGYRAPSAKRLMDAFGIERETANKIRKLLRGEIKASTFESVKQEEEQAWHPLSSTRKLMLALNELLDGCGVEYVMKAPSHAHAMFAYVNMGDTYNATIVYKYESDNFYITTLGGVVERNSL